MNGGNEDGGPQMFPLDLERVEKNARESTTQDLLDRVTVYREDMEPEHRRGARARKSALQSARVRRLPCCRS
jgi:hypothetical protein